MANSKNDAAASAFWKAAEAYAKHLADNEGAVEMAWKIRGFADASTGNEYDKSMARDGNYGRDYKRGWAAAAE